MSDGKKVFVILWMFIFLAITGLAVSKYFEVNAFNRVSEKKLTYWDAVFLNLRVEAK